MIRKRQLVWLCFVLALLLLAPQVEAKVTRVTASVSPPTYSGQCPKRFEFAGKITVDSPGIVEYKWIRSDGASAPIQKNPIRESRNADGQHLLGVEHGGRTLASFADSLSKSDYVGSRVLYVKMRDTGRRTVG